MAMAVTEAGPRVDLTTAQAALDGFCRRFDPALLTASEAADVLARLTVMERQVTAAKARAARRVDESSMWKHLGHRNAAEWMAAKTGDPVGVAHGLLATARKLQSAGATADAFAAGKVSLAAAREIADAVATDPSAEAGLLAVAVKGDHRQLVDSAARVRQAARSAEDEAAKHARLRARRFLRTRTDTDGLVVLHAGFAPQDWARVAARLQRGTDRHFAQARTQGRRRRARDSSIFGNGTSAATAATLTETAHAGRIISLFFRIFLLNSFQKPPRASAAHPLNAAASLYLLLPRDENIRGSPLDLVTDNFFHSHLGWQSVRETFGNSLRHPTIARQVRMLLLENGVAQG